MCLPTSSLHAHRQEKQQELHGGPSLPGLSMRKGPVSAHISPSQADSTPAHLAEPDWCHLRALHCWDLYVAGIGILCPILVFMTWQGCEQGAKGLSMPGGLP